MGKKERDERGKFTAFCAHHPYDRSGERTATKFKRSTAKGIGNEAKKNQKKIVVYKKTDVSIGIK